MTTVPIPLFGPVYKNVHGEELNDRTFKLIDGYLDEMGYSNRRPGLELICGDFITGDDYANPPGNPIQGLFWWPHRGYVIGAVGGYLVKFEFGSPQLQATILGDALLDPNEPVTFTTDGTYVFAANGGEIVYSNGTANAAVLGDADAPDAVTHVAYLDGYILANLAGTNKFHHSVVNNSLSWENLDFFSAAGDADNILALAVMNREIFLPGVSTTEIWENDGVNPFIRVPGGFIETGCGAPYSLVKTKDGLFWLNDKRHFVHWQNGQIQELPSAYHKEIAGFTIASDCIGHAIEINGQRFIVWNFLSAERTLVYSLERQDWCEWGFWSSEDMSYSAWRGMSYCHAPDWGMHLVGDRYYPYVYQMSPDIHTDVRRNDGFNGETEETEIRCLRRTGHISYGTNARKRCNRVTLRLKRGVGGIGREPKLILRWRDDNAAWSNELEIGLGETGNREIVTIVHPRGIYRTRQYELVATDGVPIVYGEAFEDLDVLT